MSRLLLYLPALACPLLMLVCMAGMRRMGSGTSAETEEPPPASTADRITRLGGELSTLRAEQQHVPAALPERAATSRADPPSAQRVS
jgi:hypothetical protein